MIDIAVLFERVVFALFVGVLALAAAGTLAFCAALVIGAVNSGAPL